MKCPIENQFFDNPDGEMGLAGADLADDQETFVPAGITFLGEIGSEKVSFGQRWMSARKVGVVVVEFTVLVATGDAS